MSTGYFAVAETKDSEDLRGLVEQINPSEILVPHRVELDLGDRELRELDALSFDEVLGLRVLINHFQVRDLSGFGIDNEGHMIGAAAAALCYAQSAHQQSLDFIESLQRFSHQLTLQMDAPTRRNLEIDTKIWSDATGGTLFDTVNFSSTPAGARLLRNWLNEPCTDLTVVLNRLDVVGAIDEHNSADVFAALLKPLGDVQRSVTRVALRTATPRDLVRIETAIRTFYELQTKIEQLGVESEINYFATVPHLTKLSDLIGAGIVDNPPVSTREGGVIEDGFDQELDELRKVGRSEAHFLQELENEERERSGISTLRVGFNRVHGYYIETSRALSSQVPDHYVRRQTLKNVERFVTPKLREFEERYLLSESQTLEREKELYEQILNQVSGLSSELRKLADILARVDVLTGFALAKREYGWVRPQFTDRSLLEIEEGKHPVMAAKANHAFVPNSIKFDEFSRMLVITGPNMGVSRLT